MNMTMGAAGAPSPGVATAPGDASGQKPDAKSDEPKESGAFMTIQPALKAMLDRLDTKQPILALAVDIEAAKGKIAPLSADPVGFDVVVKEAQTVGAAIIWKDHLSPFIAGGDFGGEDGARRRLRDLERKSGKDLTTKMGRLLGVPVELLNESTEADPFGSEEGTGGPPDAWHGIGGASWFFDARRRNRCGGRKARRASGRNG